MKFLWCVGVEGVCMNENEIRYKGYLIRECSYELEAGGWVPEAIVFEPTNRGMKDYPPVSSRSNATFSTLQHAADHALGMAKDFINQKLAEGR